MIKKILKSIAISAMALTVIISHTACKSNETNETAGDPVSKTEFHLNTSCTIEIRNMETSKANDVSPEIIPKFLRKGIFKKHSRKWAIRM